jgi:hypothetical protein
MNEIQIILLGILVLAASVTFFSIDPLGKKAWDVKVGNCCNYTDIVYRRRGWTMQCLRQKIRISFANSHVFEDVQFKAFCPVVVSSMFDPLQRNIFARLIYV